MPIDRRTFLGFSATLAALPATPALAAAHAAAHAATVEAPMRRKIPGTNVQLPVIGMGTADTFNVGTGPDERAPLTEVMALLLQRIPGAVVDTAPSYGSAEAVTGDLLQAAKAASGCSWRPRFPPAWRRCRRSSPARCPISTWKAWICCRCIT